MKTMWVVVTCVALVLAGVAAKAQQKDEKSYENTADLEFSVWGTNGNYYVAYMPADTLRKSPNLDLAHPQLPKSFQEIIDIAFAELEKHGGKKPDWVCTSISFCQPGFKNNHPELTGKWLFAVQLEGPYENPGKLILPVTLDGRPGVIREKPAKKPAVK